MTQQEILEYNKRCALFLGWTYVKDGDSWIPPKTTFSQFYTFSSNLMYHSDWNWIMEVKEKICKLDIVDEFNTRYDSVAKGFYCSISPAYKNTFDVIYTDVLKTEKEAVVQAINQFLIWYN